MQSFPFFAALLGSMLHVISGPDHLAAVIPFAIESKRKAWKIGLFWGVGHLLGMLLIGVLFLVFKEWIPIEKISAYSEKIVGVVLIFIGVWSFYQLFSKQHKHTHVHTDGAVLIHSHKHHHRTHERHEHAHDESSQSILTSLSVGLLHGFAGVSHFILFLPVMSFKNNLDTASYFIGFGFGTLMAMTLFAWVVGRLSLLSKGDHSDHLFKGIRFAGGLFAIIVGIYWLTR